jgi:acetolactate synthase-1/2/3 large subunit
MSEQDPKNDRMNGAESLVRTLLAGGVDTCFANPGTSEMHFVAALDQIAGMHCVLGLQENIVTGMADGYYRIARKPACTLLHCGPGLANGTANLHNARRARSSIVNIVGDQATYHRPLDAPLTADTDGLARVTSNWVRTTTSAPDVGRDAAAAIQAARTHPGQIATLILPSDASWDSGGFVAEVPPPPSPALISPRAVEEAARILRRGEKTLILLAGDGVRARSQELAWRIAQATGAALMADFVNGCIERGRGRAPIERVPYGADAALRALAPFQNIILVNARPPVGFFAYPGKPSIRYRPDAKIHILSRPEQQAEDALRALVDELGAPEAPIPSAGPAPEIAKGAPSAEGLAQTIAALMPEGAIVSDESISYGHGLYHDTHAAPPHDWLHLTGGAIGDGLPVATGAAVAGKGERRVIGIQADGAAMYSLQSLWTQARERLPVTTIILSNRKYKVLLGEYERVGATPGQTAMTMLSLDEPAINWVKTAEGLGVEAATATTLEQCADLMRESFRHRSPFLIELMT